MNWYCDVAPGHPVHDPYHAREYGFPTDDEQVLFERLSLEIMQAGLSWELILKRRPGLNAAFEGFDVDRVAAYGDAERARLLADARIIRNRRKVDAIIANAGRIIAQRETHGSFAAWIAAHHPRRLPDWVKLFRKTFVFTGPEVVNEFLMSIGYLPGSHAEDCPVQQILAEIHLPWRAAVAEGFDYTCP